MRKFFFILKFLFFVWSLDFLEATEKRWQLPRKEYEGLRYLFSHGLGGNKDSGKMYANILSFFPLHALKTYDFPCALPNTYHGSLAGQLEKNAFKKEVDCSIPIVCVGTSLGGGVTIQLPTLGIDTSHVKAMILSCPLSDIYEVVDNKTYGFVPKWAADWFLKNFTARDFDPKHPQPIEAANKIKCPTLIFHSLEDSLIPVESSQKLYDAIKAGGNKDVYLYQERAGDHGQFFNNKNARDKGEKIVQAFSRKYGLYFHSEELAGQGEALLKDCQPEKAFQNKLSYRLKKYGLVWAAKLTVLAIVGKKVYDKIKS